MALTKMGLYELLAPQFLAGYVFPPQVDAVLSILFVDELHTVSDDWAIVYTGRLSLDPSLVPVR
ncbi:MAG TPA: hypothetical protein VN282_11335 [Pyrinomonadaceae bacterium]|nr:hypothetical protein [Pyrinomonadaceae bacterium]